ncbi:MAG: TSUP family transporter [Verrucomicrobiota bacterium]
MITPWQYPVLFAAAFVAGFVDSIAGGGGLITVPVLMNLGLAPQDALGTNKLQASFGSGSAAWHYAKAGTVTLRDCQFGFMVSMVGAGAGAWLVRQLDPGLLRRAIPVLLVGVAVYMLIHPKMGEHDLHARMPRRMFDLLFGLVIGFYDGFFGPGTGTFWTMAYVVVLGFSLTRATGSTKVMNFASNISSLVLFLIGGNVLFGAGLLMGAGQWLGARMGSRMVILRGTKFIRPVFLTVVLALTAKLLFEAYRR